MISNTNIQTADIPTREMDRPNSFDLVIEKLEPFDTIVVRTMNGNYRILLLDPKTGRALVEGRKYFSEPREAFLYGSLLRGSNFKLGSIAVGYQMEIQVDDQIVITSAVQSVSVEHRTPESVASVSNAVQ